MVQATLTTLIRGPYNRFVRPLLPRRIAVLNSVAVKNIKMLDQKDHNPTWKAGTVGAVREAVSPGDQVVEIGGGWGVCSVWAAREAGPGGTVTTYEAAGNRLEYIRETLELNGVRERVDVRHGLVGTEVDIFGELEGADVIAPDDLPECDVLVMDCEGAEFTILDQLVTRPETIVVESHGANGSPTSAVVAMLNAMGYTAEDQGMASPHGREEEDNHIVVGVKDD